MTFEIALTGLNAASTELDVISNNIANTGTTGFKESRADFADVYAVNSLGATGRGVRVSDVKQNFGQGDLESTNNNLDLAIEGEGLFGVSDDGVIAYTRAGNFSLDSQGFIVNSEDNRLQGYGADENGDILPLLGDLRVEFADVQPKKTEAVELSMNLNSDAEVVGLDTPAPAFDWEASASGADLTATPPVAAQPSPDSYSFTSPMTVYDSLGSSQTATAYFRKTDSNEWASWIFVDGENVSADKENGYTIAFNDDGSLKTAYSGTTAPADPATTLSTGTFTPSSGAAEMALSFDLSSVTQFDNEFGVNQIVQDGYATGRLSDVDIDQQGHVYGRYSNGQTKTMGQIVLTNFTNEQGLLPIGNSMWVETPESGSAATGEPGSASLGLITSGSLEQSNVNLTEELVSMISAQRNFQANAQVISAADTITQTIINIRR